MDQPKTSGSFVNSSGRAFAIDGLSPLLPDKIRAAVAAEWDAAGHALPPMPKPPTYEVTNAAGEKSRHPHDESTLETDADKAAWQDYLERKAAYFLLETAFEAEINKRILRAVCLCVTVDEAALVEWAEDQEALGIPVPEKRAERKIAWVETDVFKSTEDIMRLMTAVMRLSGIADEQTAEAAERSFRLAVDAARPDDTAGEPGAAAG